MKLGDTNIGLSNGYLGASHSAKVGRGSSCMGKQPTTRRSSWGRRQTRLDGVCRRVLVHRGGGRRADLVGRDRNRGIGEHVGWMGRYESIGRPIRIVRIVLGQRMVWRASRRVLGKLN